MNIHLDTTAAPDAPELPSIASSAMLFTITIKCWQGNIRDRQAEAKLEEEAGAKSGTFRTYKALLSNNPDLEAIRKHAANTRNRNYAMTMPWSHSGLQLVPTAKYFDHVAYITAQEAEHEKLVEHFLSEYDSTLQQAQIDQGTAFRAEDYPTVDQLRRKFSFVYSYMPVPEAGDFRVDLGNQAQAEVEKLKQSYEDFYKQALSDAMESVWKRLRSYLEVMSERLDYEETVTKEWRNGRTVQKREGTKKLYESMVTNVTDMVDTMRACNVTGDTQMAAVADRLERVLTGVTKDALKEDEFLRKQTKREVDKAIQSLPTLNDYMEG